MTEFLTEIRSWASAWNGINANRFRVEHFTPWPANQISEIALPVSLMGHIGMDPENFQEVVPNSDTEAPGGRGRKSSSEAGMQFQGKAIEASEYLGAHSS